MMTDPVLRRTPAPAVAGAPGGATPPSARSCPVRSQSCPPRPGRGRRGSSRWRRDRPAPPETRGIVWVASSGADELAAVLAENPAVSWGAAALGRRRRVLGRAARVPDDGRVGRARRAPTPSRSPSTRSRSHSRSCGCCRAASVQRPGRPRDRRSLYGARVVIVGAGGVALELLRLLTPFDVDGPSCAGSTRPCPVRREPCPHASGRGARRRRGVFVAAALTHASHRLIGRAELATLAPGAILVNVARGALVDTDAVLDALESGRLGGVGLDVTDPEPLPEGHPLWAAATASSPRTWPTPTR